MSIRIKEVKFHSGKVEYKIEREGSLGRWNHLCTRDSLEEALVTKKFIEGLVVVSEEVVG